MRFLEKHDDDFDSVRAFLVISMVLFHTYEQLYIFIFNGNFISYVFIGFVLLSGFVVGVRYSRSLLDWTHVSLSKYFKSFFKITVIFFVCNVFIIVMLPERLDKLVKLSPDRILKDIFLGSRQDIFGFDVLIPIAFTMLISCILLTVTKNKGGGTVAIFLFALLGLVEKMNVGILDFYGTKLLLIGLIGASMGKLISPIDWDSLMERLNKLHATAITGLLVILYFLCLILVATQGRQVTFFVPVIPAITILLFVYLASRKMKLNLLIPIRMITSLLSNHMLFAYLFHILLINALFNVFTKHSQNALSCFFIGMFILITTVLMCYGIELSVKRSAIADKIYSVIFR